MSSLARAALASTIAAPLARHWWVFLIRGLLAIAFGLLGFFYPGATLFTLVLFYGAYAFVDGGFAIVSAVRGKEGVGPRWWLAVVGVLGIMAGCATFFWPGLTTLVLLTVIGVWALLYGISEIVGAIRLRKEIDNEWLLMMHGALAVLFGLMVLFRPGAGALALIWLIASFAIASGVLLVALAFRLKSHPANSGLAAGAA
ncbi:MAG TPA: HdeD family acid-resistance protein [Gammaproteobacteria bacterium]